MAKWVKDTKDQPTTWAGELIDIVITQPENSPGFFQPVLYFNGKRKELNIYSKLKAAKRAARREAIRMLALAITDINFTGPEGGSE